jgi:hypothetical protein
MIVPMPVMPVMPPVFIMIHERSPLTFSSKNTSLFYSERQKQNGAVRSQNVFAYFFIL